MFLTREEERMLDGEYGFALQKAMEILVAIGKIYNAERMVKISSAHVSGISYRSCGEAGIEFLRSLLTGNGKFNVLTTLNPTSIPDESWRELGFPTNVALKQLAICNLCKQMGAAGGYTCHPYLIGNLPLQGQHIAWAESSAVCFANSVLGAKTNREGGISALAAGLVGRTPYYGYHIDENRAGQILVKVEAELKNISDHFALGYLVGRIVVNKVPVFTGLGKATLEELKALSAALATSGGVALFHVEGITPEIRLRRLANKRAYEEKVQVDNISLKKIYEEFSSVDADVDLIAIGCPHCSLNELWEIAKLLNGRKVRRGVNLWIYTSKAIKVVAKQTGLLEVIEKAGGHVLSGNCIITSPLEHFGYKRVVTNSTKAAHYCSNLFNIEVSLKPLRECIRVAVGEG